MRCLCHLKRGTNATRIETARPSLPPINCVRAPFVQQQKREKGQLRWLTKYEQNRPSPHPSAFVPQSWINQVNKVHPSHSHTYIRKGRPISGLEGIVFKCPPLPSPLVMLSLPLTLSLPILGRRGSAVRSSN